MISAWGVDHGYEVVEKAFPAGASGAAWRAGASGSARKAGVRAGAAGRRAKGRVAQGGRRAYGAAYGVTNRAIGGSLNAGIAGASRVRGVASNVSGTLTNQNRMYAQGAGVGYRLNPAVNAVRSTAGNRGVQFGATGAAGAAGGAAGANAYGNRKRRR